MAKLPLWWPKGGPEFQLSIHDDLRSVKHEEHEPPTICDKTDRAREISPKDLGYFN